MTAAVVLGGGFGGVLAASVLARHVDDVTLVEDGDYPAGPGVRPGLPPGHHSHLLVTGGAQALAALLPGIEEELLAAGAHRRGMPGDCLILAADGWFRRHDTGAYLLSCSRWLLDDVVRRRALAGGTVSVRRRTHVVGLVGDAARVTGAVVRPDGGPTETIRADLVVDATGRRSQAGRWLAAIGAPDVEEATVDPGLAYSTRVYQAPPDLTIPAIMIHPSPEAGRPAHGATLFPIEGGRWIVTLTGTRGGRPPTDEQGFTDCAFALRSSLVAELMAAAKPLGGVRPYRGTANRRRYFERGPRPDGLLVMGDALVAVNPVHSHGMSIAALSAQRLDQELARRGAGPSVLADVQVAVAEEADRSWRMAAAQDGTGRREASGLDAVVRTRMSRAVLSSPPLMAAFFRAQTLVPGDAAPDASALRELARDPAPPLSEDEAIAQFPELSEWWHAGHLGRQQ